MNICDLINYNGNYRKLNDIRNRRENIIPFVGAGVSIECGLYTWMAMLDAVAKEYFTAEEIKHMHNAGNCFYYADEIVKAAGNQHMVMKKITEIFHDTKIVLTDTPRIITSSFSNLIVTTNYDTILEDASRQNIAASPLIPLLPCLKGQVDAAIQNNSRCLLKLHGSLEETSSFILTTEQYNKFYGNPISMNKPLPKYLQKLFTAKKLLFIGCSLESDRTLDMLQKCVENDKAISHYAIVPWIEDEKKRILRSRRLTQLGIDPIYFPEGEYGSVQKILKYLSKENSFTMQVEDVVKKIADEVTFRAIFPIVKEAFRNTGYFFPQLLDDIFSPPETEFNHALNAKIFSISKSDTYYSLFLFMFSVYVDMGTFDKKEAIKECYRQQLSELCLEEKYINDLLEKRWSIDPNLTPSNSDNAWMMHLSPQEINDYAIGLLQKLQYKNGMSFAEIRPIYTCAIEFEDNFSNRIEYHNRTRLLNSIGAFSYYYNESTTGIKYLERAIRLVNENETKEKREMLFLAKCHYNLALAYANTGNSQKALQSINEDLELKKEYKEDSQLYARSLDLCATLLKLHSPFEAIDIYLEAAKIKEKYAMLSHEDKKSQYDNEGSWATALFNIGLLCRDVGLYECAYKYVQLANEVRSKILDACNRDFCSSLNVQAELELILHKNVNPSQVIFIIESKQSLPKGFDKIMGHTYYVCALYYFVKKDFVTAFDYAKRSLKELTENESSDFIQIIKSKLLCSASLQDINEDNLGLQYSPDEIIDETIDSIEQLLGSDSFYLTYPYEFLKTQSISCKRANLCADLYRQIQRKYQNEQAVMKENVESYLSTINLTLNLLPQ